MFLNDFFHFKLLTLNFKKMGSTGIDRMDDECVSMQRIEDTAL